MPVRYDVDHSEFVIDPGVCPCGDDLVVTQCDAPDCNAQACETCGTGCDFDALSVEDGGRCAAASAAMTEEERAARINAERAAFGLTPIT